MPLDSYDTIR